MMYTTERTETTAEWTKRTTQTKRNETVPPEVHDFLSSLGFMVMRIIAGNGNDDVAHREMFQLFFSVRNHAVVVVERPQVAEMFC